LQASATRRPTSAWAVLAAWMHRPDKPICGTTQTCVACGPVSLRCRRLRDQELHITSVHDRRLVRECVGDSDCKTSAIPACDTANKCVSACSRATARTRLHRSATRRRALRAVPRQQRLLRDQRRSAPQTMPCMRQGSECTNISPAGVCGLDGRVG